MSLDRAAQFIFRVGVAFAFLYPPIDALFDPVSWIGYFPKFMHGILPDLVLLHGFGILETSIALWILSGRNIFWPSCAATAILLTIVFLNLQDFQIVFRDISIAALAAGLALGAYRRESIPAPI